jgi:hypothetical protein
MRFLPTLVISLVLVACSAAPVARSTPQLQAAARTPHAEFLLTQSATDFRTHNTSDQIHFQNVRVGHVLSASGEAEYILCGQFDATQEDGQTQASFFVTIDTNGGTHGYDLLIEGQVPSLCQDKSLAWDTEGDLSAELQGKFDALK